MVLEGETKIYKSNGRRSLYIPAGLINDSAFPFKNGEPLSIRVEGERVIIEKAKKGKG
jgi:hypothetical protein